LCLFTFCFIVFMIIRRNKISKCDELVKISLECLKVINYLSQECPYFVYVLLTYKEIINARPNGEKKSKQICATSG
jgi:hypothetical protein